MFSQEQWGPGELGQGGQMDRETPGGGSPSEGGPLIQARPRARACGLFCSLQGKLTR